MILTALGVSFEGGGVHKIRLAAVTTLGFSAFYICVCVCIYGFGFVFNLKKETMKRKEKSGFIKRQTP